MKAEGGFQEEEGISPQPGVCIVATGMLWLVAGVWKDTDCRGPHVAGPGSSRWNIRLFVLIPLGSSPRLPPGF